jgi:hypothetical protein
MVGVRGSKFRLLPCDVLTNRIVHQIQMLPAGKDIPVSYQPELSRIPYSEVKLDRQLHKARITRALGKAELRRSKFHWLGFFADHTGRFE